LFVVGDTKKVLAMSRPLNFNPFKGYREHERDVRDPRVREQIKEIAKLDGAIIIRRDGVAVAGCMLIDAPTTGIINMSMGLGSRHAAAAAISKATQAIAIAVSQSAGTVRIFQNGEVVLRVEPLARPMTFSHFHMEVQEIDGLGPQASAARGTTPGERSTT
jgi:DNA integrity scanning protein DisA with diadenylate cyclase activity